MPNTPGQKRAVLAISSQVARGAVGNRSIVFALETFGYPVWSVPTVLLPFHPGHGPSTRIETDPGRFAAFLDDLLLSPWFGEVGTIVTGYVASAAQAGVVAAFVAHARKVDPAIRYLCDPVIGDHGGLYVPLQTAEVIRDQMMPMADIATPNLHELAWLTGRTAIATAEEAIVAARELAPPVVLVTSAPAFMRGNIANLLVEPRNALIAEHRKLEGPANGGGDLVCGLFLAHLLDGKTGREALQLTSASIFEIMAAAVRCGSNELMPQADVASLLRPVSSVQVRTLATRSAEPADRQ